MTGEGRQNAMQAAFSSCSQNFFFRPFPAKFPAGALRHQPLPDPENCRLILQSIEFWGTGTANKQD